MCEELAKKNTVALTDKTHITVAIYMGEGVQVIRKFGKS
jgi:hypothetical protein